MALQAGAVGGVDVQSAAGEVDVRVPVLLVIETASPVPVFSVLVEPVKLMVALALPEMLMPPPASAQSLMLPDSVTVPPVRLMIEADSPVPSPMVPP